MRWRWNKNKEGLSMKSLQAFIYNYLHARCREYIWYAFKNETDGFAATTLEPHQSGLSAYVIFNCYGYYATLKPKKHKTMIVEIAKDLGDKAGRPYGRFNWDEMLPVEVSETPKIMLKGKKLKRARSLFSQEEWEDIYKFISQNRRAIEHHWIGETCSPGLFQELKYKGACGLCNLALYIIKKFVLKAKA
jgi:hypothetical protein